MTNVTINAGCNMTINHELSSAINMDKLDIKTFGSMSIVNYKDAVTTKDALTKLSGTTLTVRSGAKVLRIPTQIIYHLTFLRLLNRL